MVYTFPITDFLAVDIQQIGDRWSAVNALGQEHIFLSAAAAEEWVLRRPDAPNGDHTCLSTDPQPHHTSYRDGDWFDCALCKWESMALEWARTGLPAPRLTRRWEMNVVMRNGRSVERVAPIEVEPEEVIACVRDKVRERLGL